MSPKPLSENTIKIIKATAGVVADKGYEITTTMYKSMLPSDPKISALFNPTHQKVLPGEKLARQPAALAGAVSAYAANIDNLGVLTEAVERMAQKHVSLEILPEQYPVVGQHLLGAIQTVLGSAATPEIVDAWAEAYGFLADVLIDRENAIRDEIAAAPGGWYGWRDLTVSKIVEESPEIKSFHLKPADDKPLVAFKPGQYVGVRLETTHFTTQRNYSLSMAPDANEYRISVKREGPAASGCPVGQVSNYLHGEVKEGDTLKVSVPCGDFQLKVDDTKPVVLISGGIGITPMASMAHHLLSKNVPNRIIMVNAVRNKNVEALKEEFKKYDASNFTLNSVYGDEHGRLNPSLLSSMVEDKDAHFYFCGPPGFMRNVHEILKGWSVPENQVHFEYFGPFES
ncbi:Nitric oxide dioxygenase (Pi-NOD1) [Thraustotheca clavata]|uniref:nitric oxide dioxygenase n=1 Tax=Thraustotheca clavata TaxID=74557 RepID=A0A1V9YQ34_9STRA|nr:Nitric oxide dioxygenase (Pi-NOD1) [Thraustotheca clavata]